MAVGALPQQKGYSERYVRFRQAFPVDGHQFFPLPRKHTPVTEKGSGAFRPEKVGIHKRRRHADNGPQKIGNAPRITGKRKDGLPVKQGHASGQKGERAFFVILFRYMPVQVQIRRPKRIGENVFQKKTLPTPGGKKRHIRLVSGLFELRERASRLASGIDGPGPLADKFVFSLRRAFMRSLKQDAANPRYGEIAPSIAGGEKDSMLRPGGKVPGQCLELTGKTVVAEQNTHGDPEGRGRREAAPSPMLQVSSRRSRPVWRLSPPQALLHCRKPQ